MADSDSDSQTNTRFTSSTFGTIAGCGSPICDIAPDHLYAILLLLPLQSILSFSSTCKKFRSLACSDPLWESICRREWGPSSVDALRSSLPPHLNNKPPSPWMQIYRQVSRLDSLTCRNILLLGLPAAQDDSATQTLLPTPRASHSLNFVSGCLVLFGGGCEGGRHLDDTWVAYIGREFRRELSWRRVNSGFPSGRFGHTCVAIGDFLVLFGGINDHGNRQNDTWIGHVAFHESLGTRLVWKLLEVGSVVPPARGAHAACCIDDRKMVIHGGIGLYGVRLGDTWVLELSENLCFGIWHEVVAQPSPSARSGHSLTCIGGALTLLFGGRGLGYEVLNDAWVLDITGGNMKWLQLLYNMCDIPNGISLPRVGHSATLVLGGRLLIYGGEDSRRHRKDDFWVLDTKEIRSHAIQGSKKETAGKGLAPSSWKRLNSKGYEPNRRSFHRACADNVGQCVYVFGGMVDGLLKPAASSGLRFDGELFVVELLHSQL